MKELITKERNEEINEYLNNLTPNKTTEYSLWNAINEMQENISELQTNEDLEKAERFAEHLTNVFQ